MKTRLFVPSLLIIYICIFFLFSSFVSIDDAPETHSFFSTRIRSIKMEPRRNYNFKDDETSGNREREGYRRSEETKIWPVSRYPKTWRVGLFRIATRSCVLEVCEILVNATAIVADVSEIMVLERKRKHAKRSCSSLTTISRKSSSRNNFAPWKAKDNTLHTCDTMYGYTYTQSPRSRECCIEINWIPRMRRSIKEKLNRIKNRNT